MNVWIQRLVALVIVANVAPWAAGRLFGSRRVAPLYMGTPAPRRFAHARRSQDLPRTRRQHVELRTDRASAWLRFYRRRGVRIAVNSGGCGRKFSDAPLVRGTWCRVSSFGSTPRSTATVNRSVPVLRIGFIVQMNK